METKACPEIEVIVVFCAITSLHSLVLRTHPKSILIHKVADPISLCSTLRTMRRAESATGPPQAASATGPPLALPLNPPTPRSAPPREAPRPLPRPRPRPRPLSAFSAAGGGTLL